MMVFEVMEDDPLKQNKKNSKSKNNKNGITKDFSNSSIDNNSNDNDDSKSMHNDDQKKSSAGPLLFPGTTLYDALLAIEQYNSNIAEQDATRWRMASSTYNKSITDSSGLVDEGLLTIIQNGTKNNYNRAERREKALMDAQEHLAEAESNLRARKEVSKKLWTKVNLIEEEVNKKVEEKLRQRSRDREMKRRQEEIERQATLLDGQLNSMVTQQEIWVSDLVSQMIDLLSKKKKMILYSKMLHKNKGSCFTSWSRQ